MAATAGGVAVGSAIGHTVGHALTGAFSGGSSAEPAPVQAQPQQGYYQQQSQMQPCEAELKQFLNCAQEQSDITLCDGFNTMLKECRMRFGSPHSLSNAF